MIFQSTAIHVEFFGGGVVPSGEKDGLPWNLETTVGEPISHIWIVQDLAQDSGVAVSVVAGTCSTI